MHGMWSLVLGRQIMIKDRVQCVMESGCGLDLINIQSTTTYAHIYIYIYLIALHTVHKA